MNLLENSAGTFSPGGAEAVVATPGPALLGRLDVFPATLQPPAALQPGQNWVNGTAGQIGRLANLQPIHLPSGLDEHCPHHQ